MKKVISIVLALSMSLALLAGCGGNNSQQGTDAGQTAQTQEEGGEEQTAQTQEEGVEEQTAQAQEKGGEEQTVAEPAETDQSTNVFSNSISMPDSKYSETWDCPYTGFTVNVPENMKDYKGQLFPADSGENGSGSGIYEGHIHYLARTDEEVLELDSYLMEHADIQYADDELKEEYENKLVNFYDGMNMPVIIILGLKNSLDFEEVRTSKYGVIPVLKTGEIGSAGNYNFYYIIPDYAQYVGEISSSMPEDLYAEFGDIMVHAEDLVSCISVKEPIKTGGLPEVGDTLYFDTTDLEGNAVTNEELFGGHKVTMINLWATWCSPCVNELAELEEFNKELADKDCQVIGVCMDTNMGEDVIEGAKSILSSKGVTYTNLVVTQDILNMLPVTAVPTTFFVDSEGKVLTAPVTGANFTMYRSSIDEALEALGE